ncbi:MAG: hypothetical protein AAGA60_31010 [Cyanobacteria bacterium P01_E01_bin.42]
MTIAQSNRNCWENASSEKKQEALSEYISKVTPALLDSIHDFLEKWEVMKDAYKKIEKLDDEISETYCDMYGYWRTDDKIEIEGHELLMAFGSIMQIVCNDETLGLENYDGFIAFLKYFLKKEKSEKIFSPDRHVEETIFYHGQEPTVRKITQPES